MNELENTAPEPPEPPEPQGRSGWQYATPVVMLAVYLIGPWIGIPLAGANAAGVMIALIFGTALTAGVIDGATFRPTLSLPILAGVGFLFSKVLYFNDGTFIYCIGAGLAAAERGADEAASSSRRQP